MRDPQRSGWATRPFAVILGTNEIASAVAVHLHRGGHAVVMSHDQISPVIRRKMSFHDALFDDLAILEDVSARRADSGIEILSELARAEGVVVTTLGLLDLIVLRTIDVLVDARMQKYQETSDLRRLARFTIGLGPGFSAGDNCEFAIETRPAKAGRIIRRGPTDRGDGQVRRLGHHGAERFIYSAERGRWHTAVEIGTRIFKDFVTGHLDGTPIRAPFDGALRGVVRDGTEVPAGVKLLEIDPRRRRASWTGIESRASNIAKAVAKAVSINQMNAALEARHTPYLVK
ncbi:MAG: xanthine dehydrogenase [Parvibaculum sp.]|nr:xanthine dehydrogenase [Parvibaculum sp.]